MGERGILPYASILTKPEFESALQAYLYNIQYLENALYYLLKLTMSSITIVPATSCRSKLVFSPNGESLSPNGGLLLRQRHVELGAEQ